MKNIEKQTLIQRGKNQKKKAVSNGVNEFAKELSKYRELSDEELVQLVKAGEITPFDE